MDSYIPSSDPETKPQTVSETLVSKHPPAQPASAKSILSSESDPPTVHPVMFDCIDAASIRTAALWTDGAAGPSCIDTRGWRRICHSFQTTSYDLCQSLALLARRLCTVRVDPQGLVPLMVCRLIALDKSPGVRPIGICETVRRIIAKAILKVIRSDILDAAGSIQLCAGQTAGTASNAFNSLNRQAALLNIRHLYPPLATVIINTYRQAADLYVDGTTLYSQEGTTQGDPLAMPMYAIAILPLICRINEDIKQVWYADDATATGCIANLRSWWVKLVSIGPAYGYHVNASKIWLVVKEPHLSAAISSFGNTQVNITTESKPHLGAALGTQTYIDQYVAHKVQLWSSELKRLSSIATYQPHATYAAFTHGTARKWCYIARTIPNISHLLQPLEDIIRSNLIPALTGRAPSNDLERNLFALPSRLGGICLVNPTKLSESEYPASKLVTKPLCDLIFEQNPM